MDIILKNIRNWSEVWGLLIPLFIILRYHSMERSMRPVKLYVWVGLFLSLISTTMFVYHEQMPSFLKNNNLIYNIHSFIRVLLFGWYILQFRFEKPITIHRIVLIVYLLFVAVNFIFWNSPLLFAHNHFIAESIILLIFCLYFFFQSIQDSSATNWIREPVFIVCSGICLYEAVNFFTFLFFKILAEENLKFLRAAWTIHNISFVVLCTLLAIALYRSVQKTSVGIAK